MHCQNNNAMVDAVVMSKQDAFKIFGCSSEQASSTNFQSQTNYVLVNHKHKIHFGTKNLCITNTYHLYVFVIHKHKKSFGITPLSQVSMHVALFTLALIGDSQTNLLLDQSW
jgi:hypothetical protein